MADVKLWRYYDLIKFLTLVNGEIYFARADKLKDPYEGAIPKQNFLGFLERANGSDSVPDRERIREEFLKKFDERKKKAALSCWHINENESAAMWEAYSRAGQGIAVRTTLEKLSGVGKPQGFEMEMFRVDYIDFDSEYGEQYIRNELLPFKNKRKEFEYEREFRIMIYQINPLLRSSAGQPGWDGGDSGTKWQVLQSRFNDLPPEGLKINVNAADFIDEIIASPDMEPYEVDEIQKILDLINRVKRTGYTIRRSRLYENLQY